MKNSIVYFASIILLLFAVSSCNNGGKEKKGDSQVKTNEAPAGLILVGSDIITDVILKPDSLGDPWELEKIKGFDGSTMFKTLLDNIYNGKVTVYSALSEEPLKPADVKKIADEFSSDLNKIAKIQFSEDWYLDPSTGNMVKKTRSIILGYEVPREQGLPTSYRAMFRIKP
jgi:hypothetical protein